MDLIFLTAACKVPCFGFVTKKVSITSGVLVAAEECLHSVKTFSASHTALPASKLWVHKKVGGDTAGTADLN